MNTIAENLKTCRLYKGMTQAELGSAVGVSSATITRYENGQREPSMAILQKIADELGVTTSVLSLHGLTSSLLESLMSVDIKIDSNMKVNQKKRIEAYQYLLKNLILNSEVSSDILEASKQAFKTVSGSAKSSSVEMASYIEESFRVLSTDFNKLNSKGKKEALKRINELTQIPDYTKMDDE